MWYWCNDCNKFYTHGGKVQVSEHVGGIHTIPPMMEPVEVEGGEHNVGQENLEEMDTTNKNEVLEIGEDLNNKGKNV